MDRLLQCIQYLFEIGIRQTPGLLFNGLAMGIINLTELTRLHGLEVELLRDLFTDRAAATQRKAIVEFIQ